MQYGPVAPNKLPKQDHERIQKLVFRWWKSATTQQRWAETAKECVDFLEGRQWSEDDLATLAEEERPALKFNKISPLVRLVTGYHRNNRIDLSAIPSYDGASSDEVADVITKTLKQVADINDLPSVDAEVFLDGVVTGRGYFDDRLSFEENDFGEIKSQAVDPFTVFPDADGDSYDPKDWNGVYVSKWLSLDEIEATYGKDAADTVSHLAHGGSWSSFPVFGAENTDEIHPVRRFGNEEDDAPSEWEQFRGIFNQSFMDRAEKNIRVIDCQYWESKICNVFIDLETGDKKVISDTWSNEKIQKVLFWAEQHGNPLMVQRRMVRRVRWSTVVGDVMVADDWSPYDRFTISGYFPYFRRGHTMGMVEDLIDPQKEINKRRSSQIDIVGRAANSGWIYHQDSVTPDQRRNIMDAGSRPGVNIEHKANENWKAPQPMNNSPSLTAQKILEDSSNEDLHEISGINESALGQLDRVQSGRALEARQRQAVIGLQMYMDNFARTKKLQGKKQVNLIQRHYTEQRMIRIQGDGSNDPSQLVTINQRVENGAISKILNDVTLGKYTIKIDETPLSASFASAQFEEALMILEKLGPAGAALAQTAPDLLIEMSSLPRKSEWVERVKQAMGIVQEQQQAEMMQGSGGAPSQGSQPALPPPASSPPGGGGQLQLPGVA